MAGEHEKFNRRLRRQGYDTMACWVLAVANITGEEMHQALLLAFVRGWIGKRAAGQLKSLPHSLHSDQFWTELCSSSDCNFHFSERLENGCVVFTTQEGRIYFLGNQRMK